MCEKSKRLKVSKGRGIPLSAKVVKHYGNHIVEANVDGSFDKRGLPSPLVLAFYFTSKGNLDFVGLTAEQLQDWKWTATVHPDDLNGLAEKWQSVMASGRAGEAEARLRRFDGEYRRFLFRTNPLHDESGNVVKWFGVNTDVEDRRRAEEELRRSEAFLAEGQRLSSTGSFFWRVDNDEVRFSAELYRLFEFEQDSPLTIERIAARVHPEDIPLLQEKIERARNDRGGLD
jgi:PAS domain S-box-containing protein